MAALTVGRVRPELLETSDRHGLSCRHQTIQYCRLVMVAQVGQRPAAKLFSTVGASLTHQEPAFHENPSIFRLSLLAPDQVTNYSF